MVGKILKPIAVAGVALGMMANFSSGAEPGPADKDAPQEFTTTPSGLKYRIFGKADGEQLTHTELIATCPTYAEIVDSQLGRGVVA